METMTYKRDEPFPTDWNAWREQWDAWREAHAADLRPTQDHFPGRNFLADEVLGTWSINGRTVELSEVTFPNLEERDENGRLKDYRVRSIGITFGTGATAELPDNPVVHTFAELEEQLGIKPLTA